MGGRGPKWLQVPCLLPSSGADVLPGLSGSNGSAVNPRLCPALEWAGGQLPAREAFTEHLLRAGC